MRTTRLTPAFSGYLDALRFGAALAVLLGHMWQHGYDLGWIPLTHLSHEAVIVFFVMSGLIIASVTVERQLTWRAYAAARMARIYSVAFPAVIFSMAATAGLITFSPKVAAELTFTRPFAWQDAAASLLFMNESWFSSFGLNLKLAMNNPYWSLCYEVWYYAIFGALIFAKGSRRWWLVAALALVAGPAVMLMFPIWFFGAWLALRRTDQSTANQHWSIGFLAAPIAMLLIDVTALDVTISNLIKSHFSALWHLGSSQRFLTDLALGLLVAWHLSTFHRMPAPFTKFFEQKAGTLSKWAGFSFTLYLFHMPIIKVATAYTSEAYKGPLASVGWACLFVGICWLISFGTERQLSRWRRATTNLLGSR